MPRNYLLTMDNWAGGPQDLVTIRVNLPDLKPFGDDNRTCFTGAPADRPAGCWLLSVVIDPPGGPTAEQAFERMRSFFHSQAPIETPLGLDKYEVGPPNARMEFYRILEGKPPLYSCQIKDSHGRRGGFCDPIGDWIKHGAVIHFFFDLDQLPTINEINHKLRKLVENFMVEPGGNR
jgi:hypothetical protein